MAFQGEMKIFSTNSVEQNSHVYFKKNIIPYLTQYTKINSEWIIDLKENISRQIFLRQGTHAHNPHKKCLLFFLNKPKTKTCSLKDTAEKTKRQAVHETKYSQTSDNGLVSKIHKEPNNSVISRPMR